MSSFWAFVLFVKLLVVSDVLSNDSIAAHHRAVNAIENAPGSVPGLSQQSHWTSKDATRIDGGQSIVDHNPIRPGPDPHQSDEVEGSEPPTETKRARSMGLLRLGRMSPAADGPDAGEEASELAGDVDKKARSMALLRLGRRRTNDDDLMDDTEKRARSMGLLRLGRRSDVDADIDAAITDDKRAMGMLRLGRKSKSMSMLRLGRRAPEADAEEAEKRGKSMSMLRLG